MNKTCLPKARVAGESIKPAVERSETPGYRPYGEWLSPRSAGSSFALELILGFRCAPPRLYANAALRGLKARALLNLIRAFFSGSVLGSQGPFRRV
jgi:hypothetical protein